MSETPDKPVPDDEEQRAQLASDLRDAIDLGEGDWIRDTLDDMHPADASDLLEHLSTERFEAAVELLDGELPSEILIELREEYREDAVEIMSDEAVVEALDDLETDDATAVLEDLDEDRRERILDELEPEDRAVLEASFEFEEDTAGRLMQREFLAAPEFWTIGQTIDFARDNAADLPTDFYEIYVVDPTNKPLGYVLLSQLLRTGRDVKLADIMGSFNSDIHVDQDQEEVAYQFQKYALASAPVKDHEGRLVGMITVDDMVHVIQEENTEDLLALANVSSADGSDTVWESVKARAPWLGINLITAFVASAIIALFEGTLDRLVQLAILMPVVAALAGNAGSQGLAVAVRAIAEREMEGKAGRRAVVRETLTGVVNGGIFAIGVALVALFWFQDVKLSIILGVAMFASFVWAGVSGILVPLTLKRMGADPAVASSVFVLTLTDVMAFFSFLGLATLFLL
ncbi:MAG: magnesium transporter [Hyphomonas sp.]|jgi:magnesium transporter|nr:magnesium transporter [Henriciella sp.]MBO6696254.1 magnesium transporter [Henriciella sp.]MCR9224124.1 magnesium transporter [Hyphomonas sp.]